MRSKTSYFNRALFGKTVKRFWPIWFAYFAVWFVTLPVAVNAMLRWSRGGNLVNLQSEILKAAHYGGLAIGGIFAILSVMAVWSFMYSARSVSAAASLPVRRESMFLSVSLAGFLPLLICNVLIFLACLGIQAVRGTVAVQATFWGFGIASLQLVFFYGFALLCAQLTGNILALPAVYLVLNFTVYVVENLFRGIATAFVYGCGNGITGIALAFLSPPVELISAVGAESVEVYNEARSCYETVSYIFSGWGVLAAYAAAGIILAIGALLLYRKRAMESAGDVVAVKVLKPVFKYCMTFGCAEVVGWILFYMSDIPTDGGMQSMLIMLAFMLLGAFMGYFISEMLIRKSFAVWKGHWLGIGVSAAIIAALMFGMEFDAFGYERRVPDAKNVESVTVSTGVDAVKLCEPENIQAALSLHKDIVANKNWHESGQRLYEASHAPAATAEEDDISAAAEQTQYLQITYTLSSGREMCRSYSLFYVIGDESTYGDVLALQELINTREAIANRKATVFEFTADNIMSASVTTAITAADLKNAENYGDISDIYDNSTDTFYPIEELLKGDTDEDFSGQCTWSLSAEEASELLNECIIPDMADGSLGKIWLITGDEYDNSVYDAYISVDARIRRADYFGADYNGGYYDSYVYDYFYTYATTESTRTNTWLTEHGIPLYTYAQMEQYDESGALNKLE